MVTASCRVIKIFHVFFEFALGALCILISNSIPFALLECIYQNGPGERRTLSLSIGALLLVPMLSESNIWAAVQRRLVRDFASNGACPVACSERLARVQKVFFLAAI